MPVISNSLNRDPASDASSKSASGSTQSSPSRPKQADLLIINSKRGKSSLRGVRRDAPSSLNVAYTLVRNILFDSCDFPDFSCLKLTAENCQLTVLPPSASLLYKPPLACRIKHATTPLNSSNPIDAHPPEGVGVTSPPDTSPTII